MNAARVFVDTNVLLYVLDSAAPQKREIARRLVDQLCSERRGYVSNQVLKEYASNLIRKAGKSPVEAAVLCSDLVELAIVPEGLADLQEALRIMTIASISFWDACIVAAAKSAGCSVLLTEDFRTGQSIAGIKIENPFA